MLGGLTPGNLSKIGGDNGANRVASAIEGVQLASNRISQEEIGSESSPATKQRKNFAKSIQLNMNDKAGSQLRHLTEIAPSAHHRFDKESVHLRTMYRKLYPSEGPKTNRNQKVTSQYVNDTASVDSGVELLDLQARKTLLGANGLLNQRAYETTGF